MPSLSAAGAFMLRTVFLPLVLVIAIGGGAASVWYALRSQEGVGAVTIGVDGLSRHWHARRRPLFEGTRRARGHPGARPAEGLAFVAKHDAGGAALRAMQLPDRRLHPAGPLLDALCGRRSRAVIAREHRRKPALHSLGRCANPDNSFSIAVGRHRRAGQLAGRVRERADGLVLTLYDTPAASSSGIADIELAGDQETACDG